MAPRLLLVRKEPYCFFSDVPVEPLAGAGGFIGFCSVVVEPDEPVLPEAAPVLGVSLLVSLEPLAEPLADGVCELPEAEPVVPEAEPVVPEAEPVLPDAAPVLGASLFVSLEPLAAGVEDEPEAAEPPVDFSLFELDAPLEAEPSMPSADSVCWSSWPLAFRPFDCWKSLSAFCVCGPILPSAVTFSFSWTFLMSSASCWPPVEEPAAAEPDFCDLADEPAAAEPDFCSLLVLEAPDAAAPDLSLEEDAPLAGELELVLPDALPLAEGVDEGVDEDEAPLAGELELAPPDTLPEALVSLDFCSVDALPLAEVPADELPLEDISFCFALSVDALPPAAALPLAEESVEGFCSWLIEGDELEGDCCCLSCATAESDNIAAATATAIGLNLIEIVLS